VRVVRLYRSADRGRERERGQVLVLFALSLVVIMAVGALLYSGAHALVLRRQLQDSGDAAVLAAANKLPVVGSGVCTAARVAKRSNASTADGGDLYEAAFASVKINLGWSDSAVWTRMTVSCPTNSDYQGYAVQIDLSDTGPGFFGNGNLAVATSSVAINGAIGSGDYSVALLDPSHITWPSVRRGCASFTVNGGITATFEGSIMVDSTCLLSQSANGAMKAANASFQMIMINGATVRVAGEASAGTAARVTPTPVEHALPIIPDTLATGLLQPCNATDPQTNCKVPPGGLPVVNMKSNGQGVCKNQEPCVLTPGTYSSFTTGGGSNPNTVLLRPGVYYLRGGGLTLGSGSRVYAVPNANALTCGDAQNHTCDDVYLRTRYTCPVGDNTDQCTQHLGQRWELDCPAPTSVIPTSTCGVLIYNSPSPSTGNWNTNGDAINVGAQGSLELRAYNPDLDAANGTAFGKYKNLVIWQQRTPLPSGSGPTQPAISLSGGACVTLSGTVYASGAKVDFGGGSCGSGGGDATLKLQFVVWDLTLSGNNNFYFAYQKDFFVKPVGYGLIQ
jgi:hypothetical protein